MRQRYQRLDSPFVHASGVLAIWHTGTNPGGPSKKSIKFWLAVFLPDPLCVPDIRVHMTAYWVTHWPIFTSVKCQEGTKIWKDRYFPSLFTTLHLFGFVNFFVYNSTVNHDSSLYCNSEIVLKHKILNLNQINIQFCHVHFISFLSNTMTDLRTYNWMEKISE